VGPLHSSQIESYLRFRWRQAGGQAELPFSEDTVDYLGLFSGGIPRVLNAICDSALLIAFVEQSQEVRPEHVVEVAKDLALREVDRTNELSTETPAEPSETWDPAEIRNFIRATLA
jgi:general secretion pathway protein A